MGRHHHTLPDTPECLRADCLALLHSMGLRNSYSCIDFAAIEVLAGLMLAVGGGAIGGLLCHWLLGRRGGDSG